MSVSVTGAMFGGSVFTHQVGFQVSADRSDARHPCLSDICRLLLLLWHNCTCLFLFVLNLTHDDHFVLSGIVGTCHVRS